MIANDTTHRTAALLFQSHDPLNFKHLATTLNLILEPAGLRFRVIHERAGMTAVLSCRRLHISIVGTDAALASEDLQRLFASHASELPAHIAQRLAAHQSTIEINVGTGPLPHSGSKSDPETQALVPLLTQMVTNHLMNMNPAQLVYWGETDSLMRPRDFLDMINAAAPDYAPPAPKPRTECESESEILPEEPVEIPLNSDETEQVTLRQLLMAPDVQEIDTQTPTRVPSFLVDHLAPAKPEPKSAELSGHVASRFQQAVRGPKSAYIVSFATILVAPIVGLLLVFYNFMGGARLRPTALMACLAAAVALAADIAQDYRGAETASVPVETSGAAQL